LNAKNSTRHPQPIHWTKRRYKELNLGKTSRRRPERTRAKSLGRKNYEKQKNPRWPFRQRKTTSQEEKKTQQQHHKVQMGRPCKAKQ
jgi:hypothetical protein